MMTDSEELKIVTVSEWVKLVTAKLSCKKSLLLVVFVLRDCLCQGTEANLVLYVDSGI